jgi:hypothetical protein
VPSALSLRVPFRPAARAPIWRQTGLIPWAAPACRSYQQAVAPHFGFACDSREWLPTAYCLLLTAACRLPTPLITGPSLRRGKAPPVVPRSPQGPYCEYMARPKEQVVLLKARFLEEFRERGNITASVRAVGIARRTVHMWRKSDEEFAEAYEDAAEEALDLMEYEARRRAMGQVQLPVYYLGGVVGHMPRYSDPLLMFLLRAHRPEKYRERCQHRVEDTDRRQAFPLEALRALVEDAEDGR